MRIQVIQCTIRLLTTLPSTFVHALNLFVATTRALVLLSAGDGNERVDLGERVRLLFVGLSTMDDVQRMRVTYLARTRSSARWCPLSRGPGARRAVRSTRHPMRVTSILLWPVLGISRGRCMTRVMRHVVGGVRRVGGVGGTRRGYVWIYRYLRVRLDVLGMMMVILVSILQGH